MTPTVSGSGEVSVAEEGATAAPQGGRSIRAAIATGKSTGACQMRGRRSIMLDPADLMRRRGWLAATVNDIVAGAVTFVRTYLW
jgi:hypothetical protein